MTDPIASDAPADRPAAPWLRLLAVLYESLVVVAILMVTVMLCLLLSGGELDYHAWWYRVALLAAPGLYFVISWSRGGQTLAMRPWRLRLVASGGGRVPVGRALVRYAVLAAPLLLLALDGLGSPKLALLAPVVCWALFLLVAVVDQRRRALHDLVAGTELRRRAPAR